MKLLVTIVTLLSLATSIVAQEWEEKEVSGIKYMIPTPNQPINTPEASGVFYNQRDVYITVTSIPDTTQFIPETRLERSRYYAATAATVTIKLRGKMVDNRDTMIGDNHLYYTAVEVMMPDSAISRYELLQYMLNDTLHGFSAQYLTADAAGVAVRDKFYDEIQWLGSKNRSWIIWAVAVAALLVFGFAYWGLRRNLEPDTA